MPNNIPNAKFTDWMSRANQFDQTQFKWFNFLKTIAMNMFEWEGLPVTMNERFLERTFFENGVCGVWEYDKELKELVGSSKKNIINTYATYSDTLNIYGEPTGWNLYSPNGVIQETRSNGEVAIGRNNDTETPTVLLCMEYAERLSHIEGVVGVNLNAHKTPIHITCDKKTELSVKEAYRQYTGNQPVIVTLDGTILDEGFKVFKTDAPMILTDLHDHLMRELNMFLTMVGINNVQVNKKERLITAEADSNNELIKFSSDSYLKNRVKLCERMNEMFDTKASVKRRVDFGGVEDGVSENNSNALRFGE